MKKTESKTKAPFEGHHHSDLSKRRISWSNTGKTRSEEARKHMSDAQTKRYAERKGDDFRLFACNRQYDNSGGLIVVAARTKSEAYKTFEKWDYANNKELLHGIDNRTGKVCVKYSNYPKNKWYEIKGVSVNTLGKGQWPRVIAEGGYNE